MSQTTSQLWNFAERIIAYDARGNQASPTNRAAVFAVMEKLQPHLANLMGQTGFGALFAQALVLASAQVPWLRGVQATAESAGILSQLATLEGQVDPQEFAAGRVEILAQLLGLLAAFIGSTLMLRLVREVWPRLPLKDYFDQGTRP